MSIQIITAIAKTSGLNATTAASADPLLESAPAAIGFANLLAQQMQLPEAKLLATTDLTAKIAEDAAKLTDDTLTVSDLAENLLPWLPQPPGLATQIQHLSQSTTNAPGRQDLSTGLQVDSGRTLTQFAGLNNQEDPAATLSDLDPEAGKKQAPMFAALARAATASTADTTAPRLANAVFAITNEGGKAPEAITAKTAGSAELSNLAANSALSLAPQAQLAREASPASPITSPLHDNRWATDFGQKVVWIARAEQQNAQINISPPQLGPIQITLNLDGDKASAVFASAHAEVRQAIETAMPRLREMLADAGINLGQTNVGSQFAQQQNPQGHRQGASESARHAVDNAILPGQADITAGAVSTPHGAEGLVNLFA